MPLERLTNLLVLILLIDMMVAVGLSVAIKDVAGVVTNLGLLFRAAIANYVLVPAIAIFLLYLFRAQPMVAAGFLLTAVCPAAPFASPLTALAKGNVHTSVGLMLVLAASSALFAPLLLSFLLPLIARGADLTIDTLKIVTTLLMTQLLPLGIGLLVRSKRPQLADRLEKPARLSYGLLSLVVFGLIFALQYRTLAQIRLRGYEGMFALVFLSLLAGWILGGQSIGVRRAVGLTTAARNVGVALVIATASFPGTPAVTAVIAFAIFQTVLAALLALLLGRLSSELRVATA